MKADYIIKRILAFTTDFIVVNFLAGIVFVPSAIPYANEIGSTMADQVTFSTQDMKLFTDFYSALADDSILTLIVFMFYFVILAQLLGGRTLGCRIFKQKIIRLDRSKLTYSDLSMRMLFTNGGIFYLSVALLLIPLASHAIAASIVYMLIFISYAGFLITNFIFLLTKGTTLVDMMTKTRPLVLLPKKL